MEPPNLSTPAPALLELDDLCADAPFVELHRRIVDAPIERVWPECLAVEARELRTLGPLMAIRMLPSKLSGGAHGPGSTSKTLLDEFTSGGFVELRTDEEPTSGRAVALFGRRRQVLVRLEECADGSD